MNAKERVMQNKRITRYRISKKIAEESGINIKDVRRVVDLFHKQSELSLLNGNRVEIGPANIVMLPMSVPLTLRARNTAGQQLKIVPGSQTFRVHTFVHSLFRKKMREHYRLFCTAELTNE